MTLQEIDERLKAIGRPTFTNLRDCIRPGAIAKLTAEKLEWDAANLELAAEHLQLRTLGDQIQRANEEGARREAMHSADVQMVRKMAGDRIADNIQAPREEPPMVAARQWLNSGDWSLALYGTKGNGKTFAAARAVLESDLRPVMWLHSPTACARPLYGPEAQASMERAQRVPLFVLDEFGAELLSAPYMTWLEAVLGVRYARKLRTIITSNLGAEDFKKRLGERLSDRLREGRVFESTGPSLRQRGGKVLEMRPRGYP